MVSESSNVPLNDDPDLKLYAVWPQNSIRGEVVAFTYLDHWLVFQRHKHYNPKKGHYVPCLRVFEVIKDPIKIHGKYGKRHFKASGTYLGWGEWNSATMRYEDPSYPKQGKKIAEMDLETEEMWYEGIRDPLSFLRVAML